MWRPLSSPIRFCSDPSWSRRHGRHPHRRGARGGEERAQARLGAETAFREASRAKVPVRAAENLKRRAEAQLAAAETRLGARISAKAKEQAEGAKAKAAVKIAELQLQWDAAKADLQQGLDAVTAARDAAAAAETARAAAAEAARQVERELQPISV